jgi:hypothetical protein
VPCNIHTFTIRQDEVKRPRGKLFLSPPPPIPTEQTLDVVSLRLRLPWRGGRGGGDRRARFTAAILATFYTFILLLLFYCFSSLSLSLSLSLYARLPSGNTKIYSYISPDMTIYKCFNSYIHTHNMYIIVYIYLLLPLVKTP